jgi:bifunctional pyridoxal-dependent enzyme with beta-cystathionase and maltose regulon repressor activities
MNSRDKVFDVIHLEVGEPDFDTPACIKSAICKAMDEGQTHYTHSLGIFELREAICEHYHEQYGVTVSRIRYWSVQAPPLPCLSCLPHYWKKVTRSLFQTPIMPVIQILSNFWMLSPLWLRCLKKMVFNTVRKLSRKKSIKKQKRSL